MANPGIYLEIDASDLNEEIDRLRGIMTEDRFNRVMYGIFQRTGGHVRKGLKTELPKEYHVKPKEVGEAVQNAKVTMSGLGVGCSIPVVGTRRSIGARFGASGGSHGWNAANRKRRYRVKSRIIKDAQSILPVSMRSYGGYPPFRNLRSKLGKATYTRMTKERFPIRRVEGIAIPQMPMNRSEEDVQRDIREYMEGRIRHEFERLLAKK